MGEIFNHWMNCIMLQHFEKKKKHNTMLATILIEVYHFFQNSSVKSNFSNELLTLLKLLILIFKMPFSLYFSSALQAFFERFIFKIQTPYIYIYMTIKLKNGTRRENNKTKNQNKNCLS